MTRSLADDRSHLRLGSIAVAAALALGGASVSAWAAAEATRAPTPAARPAAPPAARADTTAAAAALARLGTALLRDDTAANAVVSPLALATVLGMVQAGASGATAREIEGLLGEQGLRALRLDLPALQRQISPTGLVPEARALKSAARVWMDQTVASSVGRNFKRRLAWRYGADARTLDFRNGPEAARAEINRWTADHTAGRVAELLPVGSVDKSTQVSLTNALHFRSAWEKPFDAEMTQPRPFGAGTTPVPTMHDDRSVQQAVVAGMQVYALPFAAPAAAAGAAPANAQAPQFDLLIALPAGDANAATGLANPPDAAAWAAWRAALQPARCSFSMPKFNFAPRSASVKPLLEKLGMRKAFTVAAELRPMLGRHADAAHVSDVFLAAGMAVDEAGGEAVAAAGATVRPKSLLAPLPACAVDRPFVFALVHRASGAPVFMGRISQPAQAQ